MEQFEIKPREILFCVIIICVMVGLGVWIQNPILKSSYEKSAKIVSAVKVDDPEKFSYIKRTNAGDFLAQGTMSTVDPVSIPDIEGSYMKIEKVKEKYTMHTRVVTTTDGKGHTHSHTETYWSWDVVHRDNFCSDSVMFLGEKFRIDSIDYHVYCGFNKMIKESSHIRYKYYTHEKSVDGAMMGTCDNKAYSKLLFKKGETIASVVESAENKIKTGPVVFWVLWSILIAGVVFLFFYTENNWLED